jgi:hypothetical protein
VVFTFVRRSSGLNVCWRADAFHVCAYPPRAWMMPFRAGSSCHRVVEVVLSTIKFIFRCSSWCWWLWMASHLYVVAFKLFILVHTEATTSMFILFRFFLWIGMTRSALRCLDSICLSVVFCRRCCSWILSKNSIKKRNESSGSSSKLSLKCMMRDAKARFLPIGLLCCSHYYLSFNDTN